MSLVVPGVRGRSGAGTWLLLAWLALALSTLFAVLLVAGRVPLAGGLPLAPGLFRSALVLHVNLAVVVWFLCCAAGVWCLAAGQSVAAVARMSAALAGLGLGAMVLAWCRGGGAPILANYVPVLDSPVFLVGLAALLVAVLLCALGAGWVLWRTPAAAPWQQGARWSLLAFLIAAAQTGWTLAQNGLNAGSEALAWGPGHILQWVHILLLMSVWSVLGAPWLARRPLAVLLALAAAPLLAVPVIDILTPPPGAEFRLAMTNLMRWGSWPAAAVLALFLLRSLARRGRVGGRARLPLALSALLFLLGCLIGALIRQDTTMVPAHYHGTVGAVTLAFMALGYRLLPAFGLGRCTARQQGRQLLVYGLGLAMLALGLAWSGALGTPRKSLHAELLLTDPGYVAAMSLAGIGGVLAIGGAAWFVFNIGRPVLSRLWTRTPNWQLGGAGLVLSAVLALAVVWPQAATDPAAGPAHADHARTERSAEVARRFREGVQQLSAHDYEAAAATWHRVLELAPRLPEAHVNMGFTMIGVQQWAAARDFFEGAIELNKNQANAYYGLALALDALGDRAGALGAMRTYVHRAAPDDPWRRRAEAAIWEWESAAAAAVPNSGNGLAQAPNAGKRTR